MGFGRDKVKHLISIGGWDAAHPDTTHTAEEYFTAWESFSDGLYDGLDWDLEGNDNLQSEWNYFSKRECAFSYPDAPTPSPCSPSPPLFLLLSLSLVSLSLSHSLSLSFSLFFSLSQPTNQPYAQPRPHSVPGADG